MYLLVAKQLVIMSLLSVVSFAFSKKFKEEYKDVYTEIKEIHHDNEEFNITIEID